MNKEQALERITALEAEAKTLREILEAPEKEERWRAEEGEEYFYIAERGVAAKTVETFSSPDNALYESHNYFQTPEEAERIARVQLAYRKLDWAIRQFPATEDHKAGVVFIYNRTVGLTWNSEADRYSSLPKLVNTDDAEYILSNYKAELLTFLTGGEK